MAGLAGAGGPGERAESRGILLARYFAIRYETGLVRRPGSLRFFACGVEGFVRQREDLCVFFVGRGETQVRGRRGQAEGRDWSWVSAGGIEARVASEDQ